MKLFCGAILSLTLTATSLAQGIDDNGAGIDPAIALTSLNGRDIWISSASDLGVNDPQLRVGGSIDVNYSLIRFDLPNINLRSVILELSRAGPDGTVPMFLDVVTSPWDNSTRWSTRPSATFIKTLPAPGQVNMYGIDITQLFQQWKSGAIPNHGIQLRPDANPDQFNVFHSTEAFQPVPGFGVPRLRVIPEYLLTFPLPGVYSPDRVSSNFGDHSQNEFCGTSRLLNTGIDFPAPVGTEVRAIARGVVRIANKDPKLGGYIVVEHIHPNRVLTSIYHHLEPIKRNDSDKSGPKFENLKPGDAVIRGQVIGRIALGSEVLAPHLHLQIREAGYEYPISLSTALPEGQGCNGAPAFPELFYDIRKANWVNLVD